MSRELKRVSLDFDWPIGVVWKGYINPYNSQQCTACDGSGVNPETKQIEDDWYDFAGTGRKWCHSITQEEVDALIAEGRLMDFTREFIPGEGWRKRDPQPNITADMVNEWSKNAFGHDAINRWICVEARAKRLGVYGLCKTCNGEGETWFSKTIKQLYENWPDDERYDPPAGEGWQVWETVSEGSPISPVFATSDDCVDWLVGEGYDKKAAKRFITSAYAPSLVSFNGEVFSGIDALGLLNDEGDSEK